MFQTYTYITLLHISSLHQNESRRIVQKMLRIREIKKPCFILQPASWGPIEATHWNPLNIMAVWYRGIWGSPQFGTHYTDSRCKLYLTSDRYSSPIRITIDNLIQVEKIAEVSTWKFIRFRKSIEFRNKSKSIERFWWEEPVYLISIAKVIFSTSVYFWKCIWNLKINRWKKCEVLIKERCSYRKFPRDVANWRWLKVGTMKLYSSQKCSWTLTRKSTSFSKNIWNSEINQITTRGIDERKLCRKIHCAVTIIKYLKGVTYVWRKE